MADSSRRRTTRPAKGTDWRERLRNELARRNRADATCPVTTAIFLRVVCEATWDDIQDGRPLESVVPFWRVVAPETPLARRLRCGSGWLQRQREIEVDARG